jgi:Uma2 family endonuclease
MAMGTEKKTYADYAKLPEGAPDMVIEVLSPGTAYYDLRHKMDIYEQSRVREYWIVDPMEKSIELYENGRDGFTCTVKQSEKGTVRSRLFPDCTVSVEEIFPL